MMWPMQSRWLGAGRWLLWGMGALLGCATRGNIPNTKVPDTRENREIIDVCERYRKALEARDTATLLALASPNYFEDSGTPKADDDYGYEGLKKVISDRMKMLKSVRYEVEYRKVTRTDRRAEVEIYIDASFQIASNNQADQYKRVTEYNRLELENDGLRWMFTSGM